MSCIASRCCLNLVAGVIVYACAISSSLAEISDDLNALLGARADAAAGASEGAVAQPVEDHRMQDHYDYYIVMQPVQLLLEDIAADATLRLVKSDDVKGMVSTLQASGTVDEVLQRICGHTGLDWFIFNETIYVSSRRETTTRLVRLGDLSWEQAVGYLKDAGLPMERFPASPASADNVLAMSGPPELLAIAETLIESIPAAAVAQTSAAPARSILIRRGTEERRVSLRD